MKKRLSILLVASMLLAGCSSSQNVMLSEKKEAMSVDEAQEEIDSLLKKVEVHEVTEPQLDIYSDEISEKAALADIDTYPIIFQSGGDILGNSDTIIIEIAAATELTSDAPDDWIFQVAENFAMEGFEVNGKSIGISLRRITSGEAVTYINAEAYQPNVLIPSNEAWGEMIKSSGIGIKKIEDRIAGNTAGFLLSSEAAQTVGDATVENILKAAIDKKITLGVTNPYTSSTGLNILTVMLDSFDSNNLLSDTASAALTEYQKTSPPVAYTTAVLRNQAEKGIIDAMVMEEQAYVNTPALRDYTYVPFGIRHDHPVYTFNWNTAEQDEAAQIFVDFCKSEASQKLATERGFNRHDDYKSMDLGLSGTDYLTAQSLWKQNKSGGRTVVAVFITDISGSMNGEAITALKESVVATLPYISSDNYVGLVSFSDDVTVNLPIDLFTEKQRALFSGEIKSLNAIGGTHTYDAVLVGLDMLNKKIKEIPDAVPLMFVLTDGEVMGGYSLNRVAPIIEGMRVPIYSIAYNYNNMGELEELSMINEAAAIRADSDDIVNQLRNMFNTQL